MRGKLFGSIFLAIVSLIALQFLGISIPFAHLIGIGLVIVLSVSLILRTRFIEGKWRKELGEEKNIPLSVEEMTHKYVGRLERLQKNERLMIKYLLWGTKVLKTLNKFLDQEIKWLVQVRDWKTAKFEKVNFLCPNESKDKGAWYFYNYEKKYIDSLEKNIRVEEIAKRTLWITKGERKEFEKRIKRITSSILKARKVLQEIKEKEISIWR